jgi:hypothetical protein
MDDSSSPSFGYAVVELMVFEGSGDDPPPSTPTGRVKFTLNQTNNGYIKNLGNSQYLKGIQ